jgi:hypothetical protein
MVDTNETGDDDEILFDIDRLLVLGIEVGVEDEGSGLGQHQRVAVRRRVRDLLRADDMRAAALVFNDDLLSPFLR